MTHDLHPEHQPVARQQNLTRQEITALVDEVAECCAGEMPSPEFDRLLLRRAITGSAASAGFVWQLPSAATLDGHESPTVTAALGLENTALGSNGTLDLNDWRPLFIQAARAKEGVVVLAGETIESGEFRNPTQQSIVASQISVADAFVGGLVLFHFSQSSSDFLRGAKQFVGVLCELASDFHRHRVLRELTTRQATQLQFEAFRQTAMQHDDPRDLIWTIANEGRRFTCADRVTLLTKSRKRFTVRCISGVDTLDRRSSTVRMLERLSLTIAKTGEACWIDAQQTETQGAEEAQAYRADVGASAIGFYPIRFHKDGVSVNNDAGKAYSAASVHSMIVVEAFGNEHRSEADAIQMRARADLVASHFAPVLGMMSRTDAMPLIGISRLLNRPFVAGLLRWRWKWVLGIALAAIVAALVIVQGDFEIEARGTLQPVEQAFIFAPRDGIVADFPPIDDDTNDANGAKASTTSGSVEVESGDVVIQLRNADLDYELTRAQGEQQTVSKRLDTVTVLLEQQARSSNPDQLRFGQLTAEKLELEIQIKSLSDQLQILRDERSQLSVKTTVTGQIQTWDFVARLRSRPVRQGSHLMTIANVHGAWRLELNIPDRSMSDINTARLDAAGELPIRYLVKSAPDIHHQATLQSVATVTELVENQGLSVAAVGALLSDSPPANVRPGTAVIAKINCGRRSLGYIWLHELFRTVRQRFLF